MTTSRALVLSVGLAAIAALGAFELGQSVSEPKPGDAAGSAEQAYIATLYAQLEALNQAFEDWKQINSRIDELQQGEQERLRLVDLWTFQKREIDDAKIQPGEDECLDAQKRVLANAEKIYSAAHQATENLASHAAAAVRVAGYCGED